MISRKRTQEEDEPITSSFMETYGDLVTLLLCFFILLFSFSTVDVIKFKTIIDSFKGNETIMQGDQIATHDEHSVVENDEDKKEDKEKDKKELDETFKKITNFIEENDLKGQVSVLNEPDGVLIRFNDNILFDKGQAYLKDSAKDLLEKIVIIFNKQDRMIKVEGHTDNDPIHTVQFPSNWELSTSRAISVIKFFSLELEKELRIPSDSLEAAGYGEYHPLLPNINEENKSKNRRIEIILLKKL